VNPPVPVQVKFVVLVKSSTVAAAVVLVSAIFAVPKAIALLIVPVKVNVRVDSVNELRSSVPDVSVVVALTVSADDSWNVLPAPLRVRELIATPFVWMVLVRPTAAMRIL
jgi:hypothetical protein